MYLQAYFTFKMWNFVGWWWIRWISQSGRSRNHIKMALSMILTWQVICPRKCLISLNICFCFPYMSIIVSNWLFHNIIIIIGQTWNAMVLIYSDSRFVLHVTFVLKWFTRNEKIILGDLLESGSWTGYRTSWHHRTGNQRPRQEPNHGFLQKNCCNQTKINLANDIINYVCDFIVIWSSVIVLPPRL